MITFSKLVVVAALAGTVSLSASPGSAGQMATRNGKGTAAIAGSANGTTYGRGHSVQNVNGQTVAASSGAFQAANGATGLRASTTTYNPATGQGTHKGGFTANGANGSINSKGNATYSTTTGLNAARTTSATNRRTGNSYNGTTTSNPTSGAQHNGTCTNAAGQTVAC